MVRAVAVPGVNCGCNRRLAVAACAPLRKKSPSPTAPERTEQTDVAKLAEVVQGLTHQVRQLALILDEVREELIWAVRNDKFHCAGHSQQYVANYTSPRPDPVEDETDDTSEPPPEPSKPATSSQNTLFE